MRKTLLAAIIAATALVPPVAFAQDRGGRGHHRDGAQSTQSGEARQGRGNWRGNDSQTAQPQRQWNREGRSADRGNWRQPQQAQPAAPVVQQPPAQPRQWDRGNRGQWNGQDRQQQQQRWRGDRDDRNRGGQWNDQRQQQQRWRGDRYDGNRGGQWNGGNRWNNNDRYNGGRWNNGWRNNNSYDWRGYRNSNRSHYRLPRYYAPSGWGSYRRFGIGFTLNSILFGQQYWINDPYSYRLPDVYGPYRWVRYYNDALLVDIYTGEVVDTVYDIFW